MLNDTSLHRNVARPNFPIMMNVIIDVLCIDVDNATGHNANTKATFDGELNVLIIFASTNSYRNLCIEVITINNT